MKGPARRRSVPSPALATRDWVGEYEARVRALRAPSPEEMAAQMWASFLEGANEQNRAEREAHARSKIDSYTVAVERLRMAQAGVCAMCPCGGRLDLDHDHRTGFIRGFLCRSCNLIEGKGGGGVLFDAYRRLNPAVVLGIQERYRHPFGYAIHEPWCTEEGSS